jgi:hypothetical protein
LPLQSSKLERFTAGVLTLALAWALLAPAPGHAAPGGASDSPSREIGAGASGCASAVPSAPERSRIAADGGLASTRPLVDSTHADSSAWVATLAGGAAPALERWCLAHGTATSSP